jgi:glyoxalase family protein
MLRVSNGRSHCERNYRASPPAIRHEGYFLPVYVRTPSGALFEATVSKPEGFLIDERFDEMGKNFQVPPVFAERTKEILEFLEPLKYDR